MHNTENNSPFAHTLAALICEKTYEDLIAGFAKQDIGIEVLDLPVRQYNLLNTSGIHTMSQLLKMTESNLDMLLNKSARAKSEIIDCIERMIYEDSSDEEKSFYDDEVYSAPTKSHDSSAKAPDTAAPQESIDLRRAVLEMYDDDSSAFYGFSFEEYREKLPAAVTYEQIKETLDSLLCDGELEYTDCRWYMVYPKFYEYITENKILKENHQEIFSMRRKGFKHDRDFLGFDEFFYNSLLALKDRVTRVRVFGDTVMYMPAGGKVRTRNDFVISLIKDCVTISLDEVAE